LGKINRKLIHLLKDDVAGRVVQRDPFRNCSGVAAPDCALKVGDRTRPLPLIPHFRELVSVNEIKTDQMKYLHVFIFQAFILQALLDRSLTPSKNPLNCHLQQRPLHVIPLEGNDLR
jgi:hypothetical protein